MRRCADGTLRVEEIKSGDPDRIPPAWRRAARLQASVYAWMLAESRGEAVSAELVWLDPEAAPVRRELVSLDAAERWAALAPAFDALLAEHDAAILRRQRARQAAAEVVFPYPALRPGQAEIAAAVTRALEHGEHLLVQAATGSGKTAAALTPALRHALAKGRRLFVLTASTLQQHLVMETLRRLAPPAPIALAVRVRSRERLCGTGTLRCEERRCAFSGEGAALLSPGGAALPAALSLPVLEPDAILEGAAALEVCPFELSLDLARRAAVTVCDYNYAIDPGVALPELRDPAQRRNTILLADEVHALPGRARSALGASLDGWAVAAAIERAALGSAPLHRRQRELLERLAGWLEDLAGELAPAEAAPTEWLAEREIPAASLEELADDFDRTARETLAWYEGHAPLAEPDPFLESAFALYRLRSTFNRGAKGYASLVGRRDGAPRLERFCRDPAPALRPLLAGCHAFVGLSGTLPAPEVLAELIGLDPDRRTLLDVPPAFGAHQRRLVIDVSIDTRWRAREQAARAVAARLAALAAAVPGGCLAVLPSHAAVDRVREALPATRLPVLVQRPEHDEAERRRLVEEACAGGPCLLLAVAGGALAEGVDYPAGRLSAVAVVGPCLPAPDTRQVLLEELYEERFGRGFEVAYALPGMTRVIQSVGRLLRAESDRGVVALLGRRFLRAPYRDLLPEAWLAGRTPESWVGDPASAAAAFFGEAQGGADTTT